MSARGTNRLGAERSPYLLQHARNPVDWWPWCDEAFARAAAEDKPVFLSVGYSACHWCHVMERESFDDPEVAEALSAGFIAVKVDREERPDVDHAYQLAYQILMQRAGGWPLSMFLTPTREPFLGGTYFPDRPRHGLPSFKEVLARVTEVWRDRRDDVRAQGVELSRALADAARVDADPEAPSTAWLDGAAEALLARVDPEHGGFGGRPKFPNTLAHELLLAASALGLPAGARAGAAADHALDAMSRGGIRDHLGGGFARYSTDAAWRVPHFEKMLYDNALLLRLFVRAWRAAQGGSARFSPARCEAEVDALAAWLEREMRSPEGLFFSAQDADSEGEEGRFFVWTPAQIAEAAGADDARALCAWFDVKPEGSFDATRSVLRTPRGEVEVAAELGLSPEALREAVARGAPRLFEHRSARAAPATDDKCLASWNALTLGALADAGATLGRPRLVDLATTALDAWMRLAWRDGRLAHAVRGGAAYGEGFLDDYAGLAGAALDVFEATFEPRFLRFARDLCDAILARFFEAESGALYLTAVDAEVVLHRVEPTLDGALPSGVGLCLDALLRLGVITGDERVQRAAQQGVRRYGGAARRQPMARSSTLLAADRAARGCVEVIVVGDDPAAMMRVARALPMPHRLLVWARDEAAGVAAGVDPALLAYRTAGAQGAAVAYVCRGDACEMPARSPEALGETLRAVLAPAVTSA
ncbi:MAG: thioredoxin domain-containing protein [Polyangiales bacterium]